MKKAFHFLGLFSTMALFTGIYLSFMNLPGAKSFLIYGSSLLGFVFIPIKLNLYFKSHPKLTLVDKLTWYFGSLSFALFNISFWFKLYHLQGAEALLTAAFAIFVIGFLPLYFMNIYKSH